MPDPAAVPAAPRPRGRWTPLLAVLGIGGAMVGLSVLPIHGECGFRFLLGAPCPGCGMTRACLALLHGDPADAWRLHPMVFPALLAAAGIVGLALHEGLTGRPTFRRAAERWALPAMIAGFTLLGALWAVRVLWRPEWSPDPIRPGSPAARVLGR